MAITNTSLTSNPAQTMLQASGNIAVTTMYLCNKSTVAITANIFLMSNGSTDFGNGVIYSNLVIQGNDTYILEQERLLLNSGDFIAGNVGSSATFDNLLVATLSYTSI